MVASEENSRHGPVPERTGRGAFGYPVSPPGNQTSPHVTIVPQTGRKTSHHHCPCSVVQMTSLKCPRAVILQRRLRWWRVAHTSPNNGMRFVCCRRTNGVARAAQREFNGIMRMLR
ncbi:hypothetical protein NPIL_329191 [Nephila pilipes]|uniref:Uncharacterized protein n=1 Tax=Nephila pilipes TaxID=299642 RepID=A0A8X6UEM2_NEPPI|nr:hypothetical protein NPIL_329191 [Nephila pilipes]